jgi:adenylate cyclase
MTTCRFAEILAADVVGFSSMMEKDEKAHKAHKATQRDPIEKTTGDGFLIEFGSRWTRRPSGPT